MYTCQWRIQEFQNQGARSRLSRILRSGVCFDAPSHIHYVFVASVVNKIHIVNIVYWLKSKYMRVIQSNFTKTPPPQFFQTGGRAPGSPVLHPPLDYNKVNAFYGVNIFKITSLKLFKQGGARWIRLWLKLLTTFEILKPPLHCPLNLGGGVKNVLSIFAVDPRPFHV